MDAQWANWNDIDLSMERVCVVIAPFDRSQCAFWAAATATAFLRARSILNGDGDRSWLTCYCMNVVQLGPVWQQLLVVLESFSLILSLCLRLPQRSDKIYEWSMKHWQRAFDLFHSPWIFCGESFIFKLHRLHPFTARLMMRCCVGSMWVNIMISFDVCVLRFTAIKTKNDRKMKDLHLQGAKPIQNSREEKNRKNRIELHRRIRHGRFVLLFHESQKQCGNCCQDEKSDIQICTDSHNKYVAPAPTIVTTPTASNRRMMFRWNNGRRWI